MEFKAPVTNHEEGFFGKERYSDGIDGERVDEEAETAAIKAHLTYNTILTYSRHENAFDNYVDRSWSSRAENRQLIRIGH
jgi:hypothetical protein